MTVEEPSRLYSLFKIVAEPSRLYSLFKIQAAGRRFYDPPDSIVKALFG